MQTDEVLTTLEARAREALWRRGNLRYQLHATQLRIAEAIDKAPGRRFFVLCSRRLGKTYMLVNRAVQLCIQRPGSRVLFLAPYNHNADEIANDTLLGVLKGCPEDMRPEWMSHKKELSFPNGSLMRTKGCNNESAQFLRGGAADLVIVDEAGLIDDLEHVISDIILPMTMTTGGHIIMATTPARSPSHESTRQFEMLAGKKATAVFTIRDAPHVDNDTKIEYLVEAGETEEHAKKCIEEDAWPVTTTARREYFCEFVTDAASAVVPEFTKDVEKRIVVDTPRPPYFDRYVALDPGFNDRTGILFARYDFERGKVVVEDEVLLEQANTSDIAGAILAKEKQLWGEANVYMRVSDVDPRLIADLYNMHRLTFCATRKEDSLGAINLMRNLISKLQLEIHPRCIHLPRQLRNATWNTKATDFAKGGKEDGHYDLVAALKYLCRNVARHHNPYPGNWHLPGMPGGPASGSYLSIKNRMSRDKTQGLFNDTPLTRRLRGKKV